jgi:hypothetical protein
VPHERGDPKFFQEKPNLASAGYLNGPPAVDLQHHPGQEVRVVAGQEERRLTDVLRRRMAPLCVRIPKGAG